MVSSIGSPSTSGIIPTPGSSTAGVEAQLTRYKNELSACVNCASANTLEGKAAIAAAASKVSYAEARIENIATTSQRNAPASSQINPIGTSQTSPDHSDKTGSTVAPATKTDSEASAKAYEAALTYERSVGIEPGFGFDFNLPTSPTGTRVNVFA